VRQISWISLEKTMPPKLDLLTVHRLFFPRTEPSLSLLHPIHHTSFLHPNPRLLCWRNQVFEQLASIDSLQQKKKKKTDKTKQKYLLSLCSCRLCGATPPPSPILKILILKIGEVRAPAKLHPQFISPLFVLLLLPLLFPFVLLLLLLRELGLAANNGNKAEVLAPFVHGAAARQRAAAQKLAHL
jgi:hypothetical protein